MPRHRVLLIAFLFSLPFVVVEARLIQLQAFQSDNARDLVLRKRTGIQLTPLWRGRILDRNGAVLAHDQRGFDMQIRIGDFEKRPDALDRLIRLLPDRREEIHERLRAVRDRIDDKVAGIASLRDARRLRAQEARIAYPFLDDIPFQAALMIESHPELLPGLDIQEKLRRRYPQGPVAAHVVGYVGQIQKNEYDALLKNGFFRDELGDAIEDGEYELLRRRGLFLEEILGRTGIERRCNSELRGRRGAVMRERDTLTGEVSDIAAATGVPGRDIRLTLDLEAQARAEQALAGKQGAIVAMDVETGEVLVLASAPGYDPNVFAPPAQSDKVRKLVAPDAGSPLVNRAIASAQPPGSVFKMVTGTTALQDGKIEPGTTFDCEESIMLGGHSFDCWVFEHGHGHGPQDLPGALQRSCNIFFYNCGKRTGMPALRQWCASYGLGVATGIELPGEAAGRIPRESTAVKATLGEVLNLSIGQGELLLTPIQVARMVAAIANGGKVLRPRILLQDGAAPEYRPLGARKEVVELVRQGMFRVVNEEGGTAFMSGMNKYRAGGKTGTAQTVRGKPNHAWFGCFFPSDRPRFALCVLVEYGGKGSAAAAPLAAPVAEILQRYVSPSPQPDVPKPAPPLDASADPPRESDAPR
jgi:penicillin-binding protein 2